MDLIARLEVKRINEGKVQQVGLYRERSSPVLRASFSSRSQGTKT
jgi:hypothetical protein